MTRIGLHWAALNAKPIPEIQFADYVSCLRSLIMKSQQISVRGHYPCAMTIAPPMEVVTAVIIIHVSEAQYSHLVLKLLCQVIHTKLKDFCCFRTRTQLYSSNLKRICCSKAEVPVEDYEIPPGEAKLLVKVETNLIGWAHNTNRI